MAQKGNRPNFAEFKAAVKTYRKVMNEIIHSVLTAVPLGHLIMKPDKEIPMYLRLLRWWVTVAVIIYGSLLIIEKAKEIF